MKTLYTVNDEFFKSVDYKEKKEFVNLYTSQIPWKFFGPTIFDINKHDEFKNNAFCRTLAIGMKHNFDYISFNQSLSAFCSTEF